MADVDRTSFTTLQQIEDNFLLTGVNDAGTIEGNITPDQLVRIPFCHQSGTFLPFRGPKVELFVNGDDGSDSRGKGTLTNPYKTIQQAYDDCLTGATVHTACRPIMNITSGKYVIDRTLKFGLGAIWRGTGATTPSATTGQSPSVEIRTTHRTGPMFECEVPYAHGVVFENMALHGGDPTSEAPLNHPLIKLAGMGWQTSFRYVNFKYALWAVECNEICVNGEFINPGATEMGVIDGQWNITYYSSSSTYNVGDYVMYAALGASHISTHPALFKCKTAITTPEAFNLSKWDQTWKDGTLEGGFLKQDLVAVDDGGPNNITFYGGQFDHYGTALVDIKQKTSHSVLSFNGCLEFERYRNNDDGKHLVAAEFINYSLNSWYQMDLETLVVNFDPLHASHAGNWGDGSINDAMVVQRQHNDPAGISAWQASTAYTAGDMVKATDPFDGIEKIWSRATTGNSGSGTFDLAERNSWLNQSETRVRVNLTECFSNSGWVNIFRNEEHGGAHVVPKGWNAMISTRSPFTFHGCSRPNAYREPAFQVMYGEETSPRWQVRADGIVQFEDINNTNLWETLGNFLSYQSQYQMFAYEGFWGIMANNGLLTYYYIDLRSTASTQSFTRATSPPTR